MAVFTSLLLTLRDCLPGTRRPPRRAARVTSPDSRANAIPPDAAATDPYGPLLWIWLSRVWHEWQAALVIVKPEKPETVIVWHAGAFGCSGRGRSIAERGDRPSRSTFHSDSSDANLLWGAPRIRGELLKLGIDVSQATVAKYMGRQRRPPSQTWRTFLTNHLGQVVAADSSWSRPRRAAFCSS